MNVRHRDSSRGGPAAEAATRLVLQLQAWRLKNASATVLGAIRSPHRFQHERAHQCRPDQLWQGNRSIPKSWHRFSSVSTTARFREPGQLQTTYPHATPEGSRYERIVPLRIAGFDRDLRPPLSSEIPVSSRSCTAWGWTSRARCRTHDGPGRTGDLPGSQRPPSPPRAPIPSDQIGLEACLNPHAIRFVILGQDVDEDSLSNPDHRKHLQQMMEQRLALVEW